MQDQIERIRKMDHVRTWEAKDDGYKLEVYDTFRPDRRNNGRTYLAYVFSHKGKAIFWGEDFGTSPMYSDDADETVGALLHFLSLKPGDTDAEYFEDYTQEQLDWAAEHGENLYLYSEDLEAERHKRYFKVKDKDEYVRIRLDQRWTRDGAMYYEAWTKNGVSGLTVNFLHDNCQRVEKDEVPEEWLEKL